MTIVWQDKCEVDAVEAGLSQRREMNDVVDQTDDAERSAAVSHSLQRYLQTTTVGHLLIALSLTVKTLT